MNLKPFYTEKLIEAGCDEAGRGCIAGPVVAAAVILPRGMDFPEFDDSKKLTEKQREKLRIMVLENAAAYGVGVVSAEEIDEINILNASFLAMHRAIDQLKIRPELLLRKDGEVFDIQVDGFFLAIGHHPASELFAPWVATDPNGYILTDGGSSRTNVEGVFAAGDVQDPVYRQAVNAAASGCRAALDAEKYLKR